MGTDRSKATVMFWSRAHFQKRERESEMMITRCLETISDATLSSATAHITRRIRMSPWMGRLASQERTEICGTGSCQPTRLTLQAGTEACTHRSGAYLLIALLTVQYLAQRNQSVSRGGGWTDFAPFFPGLTALRTV